ncbi:hypothetical protein BpHYR1_027499 [Brachionus plicatilis]|uniref:Uncharacterized protein n=1 Tax=Brachionus plicatilis TaxID=10195 RepID=A0A3M7RYT3_BRAPC|nr:hypothetical protein BpHYR1_027499 [Brachionus plicatilis]
MDSNEFLQIDPLNQLKIQFQDHVFIFFTEDFFKVVKLLARPKIFIFRFFEKSFESNKAGTRSVKCIIRKKSLYHPGLCKNSASLQIIKLDKKVIKLIIPKTLVPNIHFVTLYAKLVLGGGQLWTVFKKADLSRAGHKTDRP